MSQKKSWSKEEEDIISCKYPDLSAIAESLPHRTTCAISQHANRMGLSLRNRRWTNEEDDILRNEYYMGNTADIAEKLKRSASSVVLRARHLKLSKSNSIYRNTNCHRLVDGSLQSIYWIGFILADGHITANHKLKIALSSADKQHLDKLASYINANVHVKPYGKNSFNVVGEQCYISVKDVDNIKKLAEDYQISKNKTEHPPNFEAYNINTSQWLALIIGFIDGDGCITKAKRDSSPINIRLKNHKSWLKNLEFIGAKLCEAFDVNSSMVAKNNSNGYASLVVTDSRIIVGLKNFTLHHSIPALTRKWDAVDENYRTVRNKLTASRISEIRLKYISDGRVNKSKIARSCGVSISAITTVINRTKKD